MTKHTFIRCLRCRKSWDFDRATFRAFADAHEAEFPKHRVSFAFVEGIERDEIKCGGRCVNATSGECECSCGGKNHGRFAA